MTCLMIIEKQVDFTWNDPQAFHNHSLIYIVVICGAVELAISDIPQNSEGESVA